MSYNISRNGVIRVLEDRYRFESERAIRVIAIAHEFGNKAEPCEGGYVHVFFDANARYSSAPFRIEDHTGNSHGKGVVKPSDKGYTHRRTVNPGFTRGNAMPARRGSTATAPARTRTREPEPEVNGEADDFEVYLTKPLTATMEDYATWFVDNVGPFKGIAPERLLALGSTLYPKFQKSDFNIEQREARRAEREAASEPEPATPPARGRGKGTAAKGTAAKAPAGRGSGRRGSGPAPY